MAVEVIAGVKITWYKNVFFRVIIEMET